MKRLLITIVSCFGVLLLLFSLTDPQALPAFFLIIPFVLIFVILVTVILLISLRGERPSKYAVRIAILCSSVPVALLILQSIGQLTARDVLTIGALFLLAYFYISRMTAKTK